MNPHTIMHHYVTITNTGNNISITFSLYCTLQQIDPAPRRFSLFLLLLRLLPVSSPTRSHNLPWIVRVVCPETEAALRENLSLVFSGRIFVCVGVFRKTEIWKVFLSSHILIDLFLGHHRSCSGDSPFGGPPYPGESWTTCRCCWLDYEMGGWFSSGSVINTLWRKSHYYYRLCTQI